MPPVGGLPGAPPDASAAAEPLHPTTTTGATANDEGAETRSAPGDLAEEAEVRGFYFFSVFEMLSELR